MSDLVSRILLAALGLLIGAGIGTLSTTHFPRNGDPCVQEVEQGWVIHQNSGKIEWRDDMAYCVR